MRVFNKKAQQYNIKFIYQIVCVTEVYNDKNYPRQTHSAFILLSAGIKCENIVIRAAENDR
jgi:hypothetical protein